MRNSASVSARRTSIGFATTSNRRGGRSMAHQQKAPAANAGASVLRGIAYDAALPGSPMTSMAELRSAFLAVERRTTALSTWIACVMLVIAACVGLYQIIARFILEQPAEWSEVIIRF